MKTGSRRALRQCAYAVGVCMLAASLAHAQAPQKTVARLKQVSGNVLVSKESGLAAGDEALRLGEGTRVITTANSEVTVVYDNGCEVKLKENQRFEVVVNKPCGALVAQAQSILLEPEGIAAATTFLGAAGFAAAGPVLGSGLVGLAAVVEHRRQQPVSPN
jgi:hypothetical protein